MAKSVLALGIFVLGIVLSCGSTAYADTVLVTTECGSSTCPLATYSVDFSQTGATRYQVALRIQVDAGATIVSGTNDHIASVNVKFLNDISGAGLDLTNSSNIGGVTWTTSESNINNSNCAGGGSGFVCSQASGSGLAIAAGGDYLWVWNVVAPGAKLTDAIHVGANYDPHNGYIVSQEIRPQVQTPEPGTLTLFGVSLLGLAGFVRRYRS